MREDFTASGILNSEICIHGDRDRSRGRVQVEEKRQINFFNCCTCFLLPIHNSEVSGGFLAILHAQVAAIMAAWEEGRDCYVVDFE